jgi:hypothetical protein
VLNFWEIGIFSGKLLGYDSITTGIWMGIKEGITYSSIHALSRTERIWNKSLRGNLGEIEIPSRQQTAAHEELSAKSRLNLTATPVENISMFRIDWWPNRADSGVVTNHILDNAASNFVGLTGTVAVKKPCALGKSLDGSPG